jgi:multidrug resistance efflux pump
MGLFRPETLDFSMLACQRLKAFQTIATFMQSRETTISEPETTGNPPGLNQPRLERIRTPFSVIWREIRVQFLPPMVFAGVVLSCYLLWKHVGRGSTVPGVGEGVRSMVASPYVGEVQQVYVEPFQWVEAGQPLARVAPVDPQARLDLLQSELQLARMRLEPSVSDQNAMSYERVRVEWLRLKQEVAVAKVNLERAESALRRNEALVKDKLVSEDMFELSLKERDLYRAEIREKSAAVSEIEARLAQLRSLGEPQSPGTNAPLAEMIDRLERRITMVETNWAPLTLVAPISGMVAMVYRRASEYVVEGEPLITINSARSDRIVAYLRQPYPLDPELGMEAEIMTRNRKRQRFVSKISEIGAQVEMITNSLAFIRQGSMVDEGLPVVFRLPPEASIRPGEIVDVVLKPISLAWKPEERDRAEAANGGVR